MNRPIEISCAARLMESLLPRDVGEVVVGDLVEEYALRVRVGKRARAIRWLLLQVAASVPRLLISSFRRLSWLTAFAAAAFAFFVLGRIEPLVYEWLSQNFEPSLGQQMIVSLLIGLTACASGGFLSTCIYRGSALFYSLIGTSFLASGILRAGGREPIWFLLSFVLIAFAAPIAGGAGFIAIADRARRLRRQVGN